MSAEEASLKVKIIQRIAVPAQMKLYCGSLMNNMQVFQAKLFRELTRECLNDSGWLVTVL